MVSGWGAMEADSIKRPRELQVADVYVVRSELCERWHQGNNIKVINYQLDAYSEFGNSHLT